ncbi:choice-of-anchor J domain-containing protein [Pseudoduganella sp. GCM10020061]|uniref:choice-of-anchor J domain-containing protein n=1 Tax=Pseudoduganella sp. GCM10020061 TaxID=3317345 RepID=UPI003624C1D9
MKLLTSMLTAAALALSSAAYADSPAPSTLAEQFDNPSSMPGWVSLNQSTHPGQGWFQGNAGVFSAHSGAPDSYLAANYLTSSLDEGTIDLWLISPVLSLNGATQFSFHARSAGGAGYMDGLEVLYGYGTGTDVTAFVSLGSMMPVPDTWTAFQASINATGEGRFAVRYHGAAQLSNYVGIDSMTMTAPVPEPATYVMLCIGLAALLGFRHSRAMVACGAIAISSAAFAGGQAPEGGMVVVRDPQTGQLRAPTPAEFRALTGLATSLQAGKVAPAAPSVRRADGTVRRSMGSEAMTYSVVSRDKNGKLTIECVTGEHAAQEAAGEKEHGHETR